METREKLRKIDEKWREDLLFILIEFFRVLIKNFWHRRLDVNDNFVAGSFQENDFTIELNGTKLVKMDLM